MFNLGSFGDGNEYTVLSHDLKSVMTEVPNSAWSTFNLVGSGLPPTVDPELGTKFVDVNGDDAGYRFTSMAASIQQTHYEGHFKIKVERDWLCAPEANNNGNSGDVLQTTEKVFSSLAVSGPTTALGLLGNGGTTSADVFAPGSTGVTAVNLDYRNHKIAASAAAVLHTAGKPRFVEVDIFWKGKYAFVAYDGVVVNATDLRNTNGATPWVNIFNNFYLGSDRGVAGRFVKNHYCKDFEIRTKCPEFSCNYGYRQIGVLSDSLFDSLPVSAAAAGDVSAQYRIQRKFNKQGQYVNITISENGGYRVYNSGVNWLGGSAPIAETLANNPVEVLVSGGTNDAIFVGITDEQFEAAALDILEKLLGENGNAATTVERVTWLIPIPLWGARNGASYADNIARAARFRTILLGIADIWDAAYPLRAGAVRSLDSFSALGGLSDELGTDLYVGQTTGTLTDPHLVGHGMQIWGDFIANNL